jgi:hypothetical protein
MQLAKPDPVSLSSNKVRIEMRMNVYLLVVVTLCIFSSACLAQVTIQMPVRKSGLWELTETSSYFPGTSTKSVYCIDSKLDRLDLEMRDIGRTCAAAVVLVQKGKIEIEKECQIGNSRTKATAVIRGDLSRAYEAHFVTRVSPPHQGIEELRGKVEARYLGNCQPGQRAGDLITDNGNRMNLIDVRNPGPPPIVR